MDVALLPGIAFMSSSIIDLLPLIAGIVAVPLYGAAQVLALFKLSHGFRYAALLPLLFAASLIAAVAEPTGIGAGPSVRTLLLFSPAATFYLVLLGALEVAAARWLPSGDAESDLAAWRGSR
jgi:hypothetical protein